MIDAKILSKSSEEILNVFKKYNIDPLDMITILETLKLSTYKIISDLSEDDEFFNMMRRMNDAKNNTQS